MFSVLEIHKNIKTYFPSSKHQLWILKSWGSASVNCAEVTISMILQIDSFEVTLDFNMWGKEAP